MTMSNIIHMKITDSKDATNNRPRMTRLLLSLSNSYGTTFKTLHNRCLKCLPCVVTHNAALLMRNPRMQ
jgi:hypothetical protein